MFGVADLPQRRKRAALAQRALEEGIVGRRTCSSPRRGSGVHPAGAMPGPRGAARVGPWDSRVTGTDGSAAARCCARAARRRPPTCSSGAPRGRRRRRPRATRSPAASRRATRRRTASCCGPGWRPARSRDGRPLQRSAACATRWRPTRTSAASSGAARSRRCPRRRYTVHAELGGPGAGYPRTGTASSGARPRAGIGRTRTAPAPGSTPDALRFAFVSCQNYTNGFYGAYADLAAAGHRPRRASRRLHLRGPGPRRRPGPRPRAGARALLARRLPHPACAVQDRSGAAGRARERSRS